jgi:hypothetical protein
MEESKMQIKEVDNWIDEVQGTITFLQKELQNIKKENDQRLKQMQSSLNYHVDELRGYHKLLQAKTQVKENIGDYLLKQVSMSPQFKRAVKALEDGKDVKMNLELKMKQKELPMEIVHDGRGTMTREFEGTLQDQVTRERVDERLKTKDFVKDKDGITYE